MPCAFGCNMCNKCGKFTELLARRGKRLCPKCRAVAPPGATACPACGRRLPPACDRGPGVGSQAR